MSQKKVIRKAFRKACLKRDGYGCVMCDFKSTPENADLELDVHHITDRNKMPHGGYVKENGVSLCKECHIKAEEFHKTGVSFIEPGRCYSPEDLYKKVGSSKSKATNVASKLDLPVKNKVDIDLGLIAQTEQMCNGANTHNVHTALAAYEGSARLYNEFGFVDERKKCVKAETHLRKCVASGIWEKY